MFGLDKITWNLFATLTTASLLAWYLLVFFVSWLKGNKNQQRHYYEDYRNGNLQSEDLQPISVSSSEFPSELLPLITEKPVHLEVTLYEEAGLDEGYGIDTFTQNHPELAEILSDIQHQH